MKKDSRLLRIGVLGCGPIAQFAHLEACRKARNTELYAICDVADDLLQKMLVIHEPRAVYRDYDQMLADPEVEAVIIATSDQFHIPLCNKAIEAGKHVFVEKPMGVSVEECEGLRRRFIEASAGAASGNLRDPLVLQIGNNRRFDPGMTFARRFVKEEIGRSLALKAWYCDSTLRYTMTDNVQPLTYKSSKVRKPEGDPKADKKRYFMLAHGSHLVDTARFLGGEMESVRARFVERFEAYCWFVAVEFADGSLGHLDLTIPIRGDMEEGFQIFGEYGSVKGRAYLPWFHKSSEVECFSTRDGLFRRPLGEDAHTYKLQIQGFADTILNGAPQMGAGVDDGVAAMRAMVAIARSAESGESVRLADVTGGL